MVRSIEEEMVHPASNGNSAHLSTSDSFQRRSLRRCSTIEAPNVFLLVSNSAVDEGHLPAKKSSVLKRQCSVEEMEMSSCKLEPCVQGRIIVINEHNLPELIVQRQKWESRSVSTIEESVQN